MRLLQKDFNGFLGLVCLITILSGCAEKQIIDEPWYPELGADSVAFEESFWRLPTRGSSQYRCKIEYTVGDKEVKAEVIQEEREVVSVSAGNAVKISRNNGEVFYVAMGADGNVYRTELYRQSLDWDPDMWLPANPTFGFTWTDKRRVDDASVEKIWTVEYRVEELAGVSPNGFERCVVVQSQWSGKTKKKETGKNWSFYGEGIKYIQPGLGVVYRKNRKTVLNPSEAVHEEWIEVREMVVD